MKKFIRIGVDLAKNYFQVHALESENGGTVTRKLKRSKMHEFFCANRALPHWHGGLRLSALLARELKAMGHEVLLMPPTYTKPYVKRGKNDAAQERELLV